MKVQEDDKVWLSLQHGLLNNPAIKLKYNIKPGKLYICGDSGTGEVQMVSVWTIYYDLFPKSGQKTFLEPIVSHDGGSKMNKLI